jgi:hypothetical protein
MLAALAMSAPLYLHRARLRAQLFSTPVRKRRPSPLTPQHLSSGVCSLYNSGFAFAFADCGISAEDTHPSDSDRPIRALPL